VSRGRGCLDKASGGIQAQMPVLNNPVGGYQDAGAGTPRRWACASVQTCLSFVPTFPDMVMECRYPGSEAPAGYALGDQM
jgi:hypothetical protein